MSSTDFFTRLERQLVEAAERDVVASPARRRLAGLADRLRPRRLVVALPLGAAALLVGMIAAVVLSLGGEQPQVEAGRGPLAEPTDGLTVEPLGTAPPTETAIPPAPRGSVPGGAVPPAPAPNAPRPIPTGPSVFVLNGTTQNGVASEVAKRLEQFAVKVAGSGDGPVNTVARSVVYAIPPSRGRDVAQLLGVSDVTGAVPREFRPVAAGADVVVVLGSDFAARNDRRIELTGKGDASGVVLFPRTGGVTFTAEGLPRSNRYFLWGETPAGDPLGIGFAGYDARRRVVGGSIGGGPAADAFKTARRLFLTREKTVTPKGPTGPVVLDSGRIGG